MLDREVRLKILGSPKQPCPVMYFKPQTGQGGYIAKRSLNPAQHMPQGRKWYLHAKGSADDRPWETKHPQESQNQKNLVRPIRGGKQFFFHVDFDNLSDEELGLLLYALEPDGKFHHKVGMGKPLGLGSVKAEVVGHFEIDRIQRYSLAGLRGGGTPQVGVQRRGRRFGIPENGRDATRRKDRRRRRRPSCWRGRGRPLLGAG